MLQQLAYNNSLHLMKTHMFVKKLWKQYMYCFSILLLTLTFSSLVHLVLTAVKSTTFGPPEGPDPATLTASSDGCIQICCI